MRRIGFTEWQRLPALLRQLDVNLAPLEPASRFNDAKSAIKWIEAALVATPTIASPSVPFQEVIRPGMTGWLADGPVEWAETLTAVLADPDRRTTVGARAQRAALLGWSPHLQGVRYLQILESVVEASRAPRREPSAGWVPAVADEPAVVDGAPLDPYPPPLVGSTRARRRARRRRTPVRVVLRQKGERLRESLREEGLGGVVRGAGRVAARVGGRAVHALRSLRRTPPEA